MQLCPETKITFAIVWACFFAVPLSVTHDSSAMAFQRPGNMEPYPHQQYRKLSSTVHDKGSVHLSHEEKREICMAFEMFDTGDRVGRIDYRALKACSHHKPSGAWCSWVQ